MRWPASRQAVWAGRVAQEGEVDKVVGGSEEVAREEAAAADDSLQQAERAGSAVAAHAAHAAERRVVEGRLDGRCR